MDSNNNTPLNVFVNNYSSFNPTEGKKKDSTSVKGSYFSYALLTNVENIVGAIRSEETPHVDNSVKDQINQYIINANNEVYQKLLELVNKGPVTGDQINQIIQEALSNLGKNVQAYGDADYHRWDQTNQQNPWNAFQNNPYIQEIQKRFMQPAYSKGNIVINPNDLPKPSKKRS